MARSHGWVFYGFFALVPRTTYGLFALAPRTTHTRYSVINTASATLQAMVYRSGPLSLCQQGPCALRIFAERSDAALRVRAGRSDVALRVLTGWSEGYDTTDGEAARPSGRRE